MRLMTEVELHLTSAILKCNACFDGAGFARDFDQHPIFYSVHLA